MINLFLSLLIHLMPYGQELHRSPVATSGTIRVSADEAKLHGNDIREREVEKTIGIRTLADAIARKESPNPKYNNPGGIMAYGDWCPPQKNGKLCRYKTYEEGYAALERSIRAHAGHGQTLEDMGYIYAPPFENDTKAWINEVSKWSGIPADKQLKLFIN